jgi:hypothetical protein
MNRSSASGYRELLVMSFSAGLLCAREVESGAPLVICEWMKSSGLPENELVCFLAGQDQPGEAKKNNFLGNFLAIGKAVLYILSFFTRS